MARVLAEQGLVDAAAFVILVDRYNPRSSARMYVANRAVAEDVVQGTWLAVIQGIDFFEGRSSLRSDFERLRELAELAGATSTQLFSPT